MVQIIQPVWYYQMVALCFYQDMIIMSVYLIHAQMILIKFLHDYLQHQIHIKNIQQYLRHQHIFHHLRHHHLRHHMHHHHPQHHLHKILQYMLLLSYDFLHIHQIHSHHLWLMELYKFIQRYLCLHK